MPRDIHITGVEGGSGLYWVALANAVAEDFQATMNQYMKVLLTIKGSDPFAPGTGTAFADLPGSNMGGRLDLVQQITVEAIKDAELTIKRNQARQPLASKARLRSAVLKSFQPIGADGFEVYILLENQAGQRMLTLLPHVSL
jgi:hypothetical protein